jgi:hypothetical protein
MNPPLKFVAIACNDFGGIGFEFYSTQGGHRHWPARASRTSSSDCSVPVREKDEATSASGSGWDGRKKKGPLQL